MMRTIAADAVVDERMAAAVLAREWEAEKVSYALRCALAGALWWTSLMGFLLLQHALSQHGSRICCAHGRVEWCLCMLTWITRALQRLASRAPSQAVI